MKIVIEVGQKEAILAGENVYGLKLVDLDVAKLTNEERQYLARQNTRKYGDEYYIYVAGYACRANEDEAIRVLKDKMQDEIKKAHAAKTVHEEKIKKILKEGIDGVLDTNWSDTGVKRTDGNRLLENLYFVKKDVSDNRLNTLYAQAEIEAKKRNKEIIEKKQAEIEIERKKIESEKKENERKQTEKKEQIGKWVATNGTDNQKKRYELGLLPETEVIDAIRDEAYRLLDGFPRYEKMKASDVCTCEYREDSCKVEYTVEVAETATAEAFEKFEEILNVSKKIDEKAKCTMMVHIGESEKCEEHEERKSVKVEIAVGAFAFSREYAI